MDQITLHYSNIIIHFFPLNHEYRTLLGPYGVVISQPHPIIIMLLPVVIKNDLFVQCLVWLCCYDDDPGVFLSQRDTLSRCCSNAVSDPSLALFSPLTVTLINWNSHPIEVVSR